MSEHAHHTLISVTEAAKRLGLHRNSVERKIKRGEYTVIWTPGAHGPTRMLPLWQVDGLPAPEGWSPDDHAGPDLTHAQPTSAPAVVEPPAPALDFAPMIASHDRLVSDLRELERDNGAKTERIASLEREIARLSDELARTLAGQRPPTQRRSWLARIFATASED